MRMPNGYEGSESMESAERVPSCQEGAEWPGEHQTAKMKAEWLVEYRMTKTYGWSFTNYLDGVKWKSVNFQSDVRKTLI